jgi:hypothetical protein
MHVGDKSSLETPPKGTSDGGKVMIVVVETLGVKLCRVLVAVVQQLNKKLNQITLHPARSRKPMLPPLVGEVVPRTKMRTMRMTTDDLLNLSWRNYQMKIRPFVFSFVYYDVMTAFDF